MSVRSDLERQVLRRGAEIAAGLRDKMERELKRAAPVGKQVPGGRAPGTLKKSVSVSVRRSGSNFVFECRADAEHASYTEEDTRPHIIRAKRASVLRFYWPVKGGIVHFPQVNHPGTKGQHWFRNTLRRFPELLRQSQ